MDSSQLPGSKTTSDESPHKEARIAIDFLQGSKIKICLGTWNVRTMHQTAKTAQLLHEMKNNQLHIIGIRDYRWTGAGKQITSDGSVILYSGQSERHGRDVAIIVSKARARTILKKKPISEILIKARFNSRNSKLTINY